MQNPNTKTVPSIKQAKLPSIVVKALASYKSWFYLKKNLDKSTKYTLGQQIDNLYVVILEKLSEAQFSWKEKKLPHIEIAIIKVETLKFMIFTLYEVKGINEDTFVIISSEIDELGKMLFGWKNQVMKFIDENKKPH